MKIPIDDKIINKRVVELCTTTILTLFVSTQFKLQSISSYLPAAIDLITHTKTQFPSCDSNMQLGCLIVDPSCVLFINPTILPVVFGLLLMYNVDPLF